MSYFNSLEAAGATVHCFKEFGSYQGDWWAKVTYSGKTGWINGSYGSCSGCDAYEAEFGFDWFYEDVEGSGKNRHGQTEKEFYADIERRRSIFGASYLDDSSFYTQEEAEASAAKHSSWDSEAKDVLAFIVNNKIQ